MTALATDRDPQRKPGELRDIPVGASQKIYGGALVSVNAAGYLVPGSDAAGQIFQGVSEDQYDNSSGANGALTSAVRARGLVKVVMGTAITQANVGDNVFLVDDQTVDLAANTTNDIFCGVIAEYIDSTHAYIDTEPAVKLADIATHIADPSAAHAASAISIADAGGYTAQTTVEGALQEIYPKAPVLIADPGDAGAIPVTKSGNCAITTAGAETRTLAIPGVAGITLDLSFDVDGGDAVITVAGGVNQTGNNTLTMADAGDHIRLTSVQVAGALVWRVCANDGVALSTV